MKEKKLPKIELYVDRTMGEKANATFDFIKENWRVWLKYMFYTLLPLSMFQGLLIENIIDVETEGLRNDIGGGVMSVFLTVFLGTMSSAAVMLTLLLEYQNRESRLEGIKFRDIFKPLLHNAVRMLPVAVFFVVVVLPVYAIANVIGFFIPLVGMWVAYAVILPAMLIPVVYIVEKPIGFVDAVKRGIKLGFAQWGKLAAIGIMMSILIGYLSVCSVGPWGIFEALTRELIGSTSAFNGLMGVFRLVVAIFNCFALFLLLSFNILAMAFHYGSVTAAEEDASLERDILNFDKL